MQFRSRSTLPLLFQTSKPIKIASKGFHLISTTHFFSNSASTFCALLPCWSWASQASLPSFIPNFCCKQLCCLENSHLLFTFAHLSVKDLIKVILCLSAIEFFRLKLPFFVLYRTHSHLLSSLHCHFWKKLTYISTLLPHVQQATKEISFASSYQLCVPTFSNITFLCKRLCWILSANNPSCCT